MQHGKYFRFLVKRRRGKVRAPLGFKQISAASVSEAADEGTPEGVIQFPEISI